MKKVPKEDELLLPANMLNLYTHGAFPMGDAKTNTIDWYFPEIRTIIPMDTFNVPRSLRKFMSASPFEFKFDHDPLKVINCCSERNETWITPKLIDAYKNLIDSGYVHSIETWLNGELAGGLYGISVRGAFFGESMFSKVSQASKCALVKLVERLRERHFTLLDVQYENPHLNMFGTKQIPLEEYQNMLNKAYEDDITFI